MKILLAGGGSGGPTTPLLAVAEEIKKTDTAAKFLFAGTSAGPEKLFVKQVGIDFVEIPAGKLRRYFSWQNFVSPFLIIAGIFKSLSVIQKFKPDLVFSAGGYVSVPVVFAARLMGKKVVIHQQDVLKTLSNSILAPFADKVTVSFKSSQKDFNSGSGFNGADSEKVIWTGNPVRLEISQCLGADKNQAKQSLNLKTDWPVLLVLGGATGAAALNAALLAELPDLCKTIQVVHISGRGKQINFQHEHYHQYEIVSEMGKFYAAADIVVTRAGLSTLTELAYLEKPIIIVPMPDSHQLYNAKVFDQAKAALVLNEKDFVAGGLISVVKKLMYNADWQHELSQNISGIMPRDAAAKIAAIIIELCKKRN